MDSDNHITPPAFSLRVLCCFTPLCCSIRLPDEESIHGVVGEGSNIAAVAVISVAIAITSVEGVGATNPTA